MKLNPHLNVLMVNWIYPPEYSGAASQCHTLSKALLGNGANVEVLAGTNEPARIGTEILDGIRIHRVLCDKSSKSRIGKYVLDMFSYIFRNRSKFNIIHSHGFIAQANLAAQVTSLPLVLKITNLKVDDPGSVSERSLGWARMSLYRKASAVVATSPLLFDISKKVLNPKVCVEHIPNGVDLEKFAPPLAEEKLGLRDKLGFKIDEIVLLFVGTVSHTKGLDMLVRTLKYIKNTDSLKFKCVVLGPDEYIRSHGDYDPRVSGFAGAIKNEITHSKLHDRIRFEGCKTRITEYYKAADILVHPSRREGQPNAIIEAMASGLPVIVNYIPGITTEMVNHEQTGLVVKCEDTVDFAHAILNLSNNPDMRKRLGNHARQYALNRYNIENIAKQYMGLYHHILNNRYRTTNPQSINYGHFYPIIGSMAELHWN